MATVCGVGISLEGKYKRTVKTESGKKMTREYELWKHMITRCYSEKALEKRSSYEGCTVSENFKNFQYFAEWCNNQKGFSEGWQLDKDILKKDCKLYSEHTCCFVPRDINICFVKANKIRGIYPIGVHKPKKGHGFTAKICIGNGKYVSKSGFESQEKAFYYYKFRKEDYIKFLAEKYKSSISEVVYLALINYTVDISD